MEKGFFVFSTHFLPVLFAKMKNKADDKKGLS